MRVLIFSASMGHGHNQVALAIEEELHERGHSARIIDALEFVSPFLSKVLLESYLRLLRHTPYVYGKLYAMTEESEKFEYASIVNSLLCRGFVKLLKEYQPNTIVCTHSFAAGLLSALKERVDLPVPLVAPITDFTIHSSWVHPGIDKYVVATDRLDYLLRALKVPESLVSPIGIPIRRQFVKKQKKTQARKELGLYDLPTVLLMGGGLGLGLTQGFIEVLQSELPEHQLVVMTGKNQQLLDKLKGRKLPDTVRILAFVDDMAMYMRSADLLVTKPGGVTCAEALSSKLPMALFSPIPGQEYRNAAFLAEEMVAVQLDKNYFPERLASLVKDDMRLSMMSTAADRLAKPAASVELVDLLESL